MNTNSISVLLGCAGLAIGGIGLLAQGSERPSTGADTAQSAWPPAAEATSVAYNDEMIELLTLGAKPRTKPRTRAEPAATPAQAVPQEGETGIRSIRMMRANGSPRAQIVDIEFVGQDGRVYHRRYPIGRGVFAAGSARDLEADRSAWEADGYAPRRSRRSYRRWW